MTFKFIVHCSLSCSLPCSRSCSLSTVRGSVSSFRRQFLPTDVVSLTPGCPFLLCSSHQSAHLPGTAASPLSLPSAPLLSVSGRPEVSLNRRHPDLRPAGRGSSAGRRASPLHSPSSHPRRLPATETGLAQSRVRTQRGCTPALDWRRDSTCRSRPLSGLMRPRLGTQ